MQQSPHGARRYYDERYQGRVAPQYDPYFYQERGSGVGPHRSAPHWSRKQQQQEQAASARGPPRQYRGPRPYRSPARPEEEFSYRPDTPSAPSAPSGANFATPPPQRGSQIPSLPRTPYWPDAPDGPRRRAFSPGAQDDVFSPVTPRRRSARWNPYWHPWLDSGLAAELVSGPPFDLSRTSSLVLRRETLRSPLLVTSQPVGLAGYLSCEVT